MLHPLRSQLSFSLLKYCGSLAPKRLCDVKFPQREEARDGEAMWEREGEKEKETVEDSSEQSQRVRIYRMKVRTKKPREKLSDGREGMPGEAIKERRKGKEGRLKL